jgi:hypothetical protein
MILPDDAGLDVYIATVQPEAMGTEMRLRAMQKAYGGFVVWDAEHPHGELWSIHKNTFLEAIYTALAFCGTDTRFEWCVLGADVFTVVRTLTAFEQCAPVVTYPLVFVGRLRTVSVYVPANTAVSHNPRSDPRSVYLSSTTFYAGVDERCARGKMQNQVTSREECIVW